MAIDLTKVSKSKLPKETAVNISVIGGAVILSIILLFIFVSPRLKAISDLKVKINSVSGLRESETKTLITEKDSLAKEKNIISNKTIIAKNKLRKNKDISSVLDKFLFTAKRRRLEFTYIKPLDKKNETLVNEDVTLAIRETPIALEMQARFTEFLGFLWEAEHSDQAFKIVELTIEKPDSKTLRQKEKLTVNVYQLQGDSGKQKNTNE